MSHITLSVLDQDRAVHRLVSLPLARAIVAALSAEPETLAELAQATARFCDGDTPLTLLESPLASARERWKDGLPTGVAHSESCLIDLVGKTVICPSNQLDTSTQGYVVFGENERERELRIWFQLSDDWLFSENADDWKSLIERRRDERESPPADNRHVLYEKVIDFLVDESFASAKEYRNRWRKANANKRAIKKRDWEELAAQQISEIHANWLTTPRADLKHRTPRDVLLEKLNLIDFDLRSRCDQWSLTGSCPPGVDVTTAAYRDAGFGTHENVVYYELLRHLLEQLWKRISKSPNLKRQVEVDRLVEQRETWLDSLSGDYDSHTPRQVIQQERMRIPLAVEGEDAMIDCDCPLCQMMAEQGPVFVHIDRCNQDNGFVFSHYQHRADWEEEQRAYDDFDLPDIEMTRLEFAERDNRVWQRGGVTSPAGSDEPLSPEIQLITIAGCLAELGVDLKSQGHLERVQLLNRQFSSIREVVRESSDSLLEPAVQRMGAELLETGLEFPDLSEKCSDLHRKLTCFANSLLA